MVNLVRSIKIGILIALAIAFILIIIGLVFGVILLLLPIAVVILVGGYLFRKLRKIKKGKSNTTSTEKKDYIDVEYKVKP